MLRSINNYYTTYRLLSHGWTIHPLAGTVSQDGYLYRYGLVDRTGAVFAIVPMPVFAELQERKKLSRYCEEPINLALMPQRPKNEKEDDLDIPELDSEESIGALAAA